MTQQTTIGARVTGDTGMTTGTITVSTAPQPPPRATARGVEMGSNRVTTSSVALCVCSSYLPENIFVSALLKTVLKFMLSFAYFSF
jgi:hypothetical protein